MAKLAMTYMALFQLSLCLRYRSSSYGGALGHYLKTFNRQYISATYLTTE